MEGKEKDFLGEKVRIYYCPKCGNKLIPLKEAIKAQEKIIPKINTTRKVVKFGNSIAVTLPKDLKTVFKGGDKVRLFFNPKEMELIIKKR